jgi:Short C-terminal domain/Bacterial PH domain
VGKQPQFAEKEETLVEELPGRLEKELQRILLPDETVHIKIKGAFKEGLICTDSRVIILKGGFMTGQTLGTNTFQVPYQNISGVEVKYHLLSGYFEISAGGVLNTDKSYWSSKKSQDAAKAPNCISLNNKTQRDKFQKACSFIMDKMSDLQQGRTVSPVQTPSSVETQRSEKDEIIAALEKLGQLRDANILTPEEFQAKKEELLSRL